MMGRGYTVILVPSDGRFAASVPAMPGCFSQGSTREEALANVHEAMALWMDVESDAGRLPLSETPSVVASAVSAALEIVDDMRRAGEIPDEAGYQLELVTVQPRQRVAA